VLVLGLLFGSAGAAQAAPAPQQAQLQAQANQIFSEGLALQNAGDLEAAFERFGRALPLYRQIGDRAGEARTLSSLGLVLQAVSQFERALELHQQALTIRRAIGDRPGEGATLNNIGTVLHALSRQPEALEAFNQSLAIRLELRDALGYARTLGNIGGVYQALDRYPEALERFEAALELYRQLGDRAGQGVALNNVGSVLQQLSRFEQAEEVLLQALELNRALGNRVGEGFSLHNLALAAASRGGYPRAIELNNQALAIRRALGDRLGEGQTLGNLGTIYQRLGQYPKALELFEQTLAIRRAIGNRRGEGQTLANIAALYATSAQYPQALETGHQALAILRQVGDRAAEAVALSNVGFTYYNVGDFDRAFQYLNDAYEVQRQIGDLAGTAETLSKIGAAYTRMGQHDKAQELHAKALEVQRQIGDRMGEAFTLNQLGVVEWARRDFARAADYFNQSPALYRDLGDRTSEGRLLGNLGSTYKALGEYPRALELLEQALARERELDDRAAEVDTLSHIGNVHQLRGEVREALAAYRQSINVTEGLRTSARLEELKASLAAGSIGVYQLAALLLSGQQQHREAFELGERARARGLLDQLGNARLEIGTGGSPLVQREQELRAELAALEQRLRDERGRPPAAQSSEAIQALAADLAARQRAYEEVRTQLQLANPEYASLTSVAPLSLPEVQALLDDSTTLVSYFVTSDKILASVITRTTFESVELPVSAAELVATIQELRDFPTTSGPPPGSLSRLHAWLIAPLQAKLRTPLLGIIPHGPLHYLPFAALTDGQRFLADEYALFALPSASVLRFVQQKRKTGPPSVLAFAQAQPPGLPALGFADREVRAIAGLFGAQPTAGQAATESAFVAEAPKRSLLHLAAHGQLNEGNPLFSRIVLGPDGKNDGGLEVHEVYRLDLAAADLVVLSACQTILGAQSAGDDIVGLNRAFIYAGAPTVVSSLWTVDDEATGRLMEAFYAHLKQGLGKAAALRQAQLEMRQQFPHPYYWAAFVLTGDPGPPPTRAQLAAAATPTAAPLATAPPTASPAPAATPTRVEPHSPEAAPGGFGPAVLAVLALAGGLGSAAWWLRARRGRSGSAR
jgi:CHAT domain-containing protein/Tfp pilus assembly protein PilF